MLIFVDTNIRYKKYERVTAEIVNVQYKHHRRSHYYKVEYKYSVNGKSYPYRDPRRYSLKPVEGNKVYGFYDPDNPKIFYPNKRYDGLTTSVLLSIILSVCTVGSVIEMRTKADEEKAKALHGIIRGINLAAFSVLMANLLTSLTILIFGVLAASVVLFDSIRKLRQLKDQYGYY